MENIVTSIQFSNFKVWLDTLDLSTRAWRMVPREMRTRMEYVDIHYHDMVMDRFDGMRAERVQVPSNEREKG